MYKDHLQFNLEREIELIRQLIPMIDEKHLDFRPAEKVRSTLELMQYLSGVGAVMLRWYIDNDLTPDEWAKIRAYRAGLTLANFNERLDEQVADIRRYMARISESDLFHKIVEMPNKEKMPLGSAIINGPIKWLTTYRMELFLYIKMNGRSEISTREAWTVLVSNQ